MKQLSSEPYKGTRDFYPEEMAMQQHLFGVMRDVVEKYGYVEYGASLLEESAIYRAKTGEEIVNEQTYSFIDRGGRDVTIRPEMTPTVARMVARRRSELAFPLRWYSIPNLFRYERPQRGRLREHWQLNVDAFGANAIDADVEIITVAQAILKSCGATDEMFQIRVNDRRLVNFFLKESLGLSDEGAHRVMKLMDRRNKMKPDAFSANAEEIVGKHVAAFMNFLDVQQIEDLPEELRAHEAIRDLQLLLDGLQDRGVSNAVFYPTLMRGFDYYTRMVFEVFDTHPANSRSLFGGGRYDDLVDLFGVEKVTAVGFGMGDVTLADFLETHSLQPSVAASTTDLYICSLSPSYHNAASNIADNLRAHGVRVAVDFTDRKVGAQVKTAVKQGIPYVLCIGEDEVKTQQFRLKNLQKSTEETITLSEIVTQIQHTKSIAQQ